MKKFKYRFKSETDFKRKRSRTAGHYTETEKENFMKEFYHLYNDPSTLTEDELSDLSDRLTFFGEDELADKYYALAADLWSKRIKERKIKTFFCDRCGKEEVMEAQSDTMIVNNGYSSGYVCNDCFNQVWEWRKTK